MARTRYIKPDFFKDEDLCCLPLAARVWFQGLWCQADREGRVEYRPKRLKLEIFPYDDVDPVALTEKLANPCLPDRPEKKFIIIYSVNGEQYIQIINFSDHQRPHHTEKPSAIPSFNGYTTVKTTNNNGYARMGMEMGMEMEKQSDQRVLESDSRQTQDQFAPVETVPIKAMACTAEHAWNELCRIYPKPLGDGIIEGKAEAGPIFEAEPAKWPRWLRNAGHYAAAKQGARYVHALDNWLRVAYQDYDEQPKPLGQQGKPPPREALRQALQDKSIATLPRSISDDPEADALFRSFNLPWQELRRRVETGKLIL